jgi:HPt (histidine-containing phosphotransfer) domain-containing protein
MGEGVKFKKRAIEELGLDESVYDELLRSFIPEAEDDIRKLGEAAEADDFDEIARIGHGLKGTAGNLRIENMRCAAGAIEALAKEGRDKRAITEKTDELRRDLAELKKWIR